MCTDSTLPISRADPIEDGAVMHVEAAVEADGRDHAGLPNRVEAALRPFEAVCDGFLAKNRLARPHG